MYSDNAEPSVEEMLRDPLVRLRMTRAGIVPETVARLLRDTKRRLDVQRDDRPATRGGGRPDRCR